MNQILRVNVKTNQIAHNSMPDYLKEFGGRGIIANLLMNEVPPTCDPLGAQNKLVFCCGLLSGTSATTANRLSIGAKSPLTNGIKESNVGGTFCYEMIRHGIAAIVIEDIPAADIPARILHIDADGAATLDDAADIAGKMNYAAVDILNERYGEKCAVLINGPAGERGYLTAAIMSKDFSTGDPCRAAGRGGLGAVMGSKGIKAVVIEPAKEVKRPDYVDEASFLGAAKEFNKLVALSDQAKTRSKRGTLGVLTSNVEKGILPVRNFRGEKCEHPEKIDSNALIDKLERNGGKAGLPCQPGCVIRCSQKYYDEDKCFITSGLQYETVGTVGSNCCIYELDYIAMISRLCDEFGIDTIEMGDQIAVYMESGRLEWGDALGAIKLVESLMDGTCPIEKYFKAGINSLGAYLGVSRIPSSHGQAFPAYDPKNNRAMGITYAVSTMGADHSVGSASPVGGDYVKPADVAYKLRTALDCTFCSFPILAINADRERFFPLLFRMLEARYGGVWDLERLLTYGAEVQGLEQRFNFAADWKVTDLPAHFRTEPSPLTGEVFDVDMNIIRKISEGFSGPFMDSETK